MKGNYFENQGYRSQQEKNCYEDTVSSVAVERHNRSQYEKSRQLDWEVNLHPTQHLLTPYTAAQRDPI